MECDRAKLLFNHEERFVSGLPESLPLAAAHAAFSIVRRARNNCYESFRHLLTIDIESTGPAEAQMERLYPERLRQLDELSSQLVPFIMPRVLGDFEEFFKTPRHLDDERSGVVRK